MQFIVCLGILTLGTLCTAYQSFQKKIPNGGNIPHPCSSYIWQGLGHQNYRGGGDRTPFGLDFKANNFIWNEKICKQDSDGDGKTNGYELGDPGCTWRPEQRPLRTSGLSHPGICDSARCGGMPSWVKCGETGFDCSSVQEPETFNFTVRMPEQEVPAVDTTYICMSFEFPIDQEYHLIANRQLIDNVDIMHHMLLYGCSRPPFKSHHTPYMCDMGPDLSACDTIGVWTVGTDGECLHNQTGFLIGGDSGYKVGAIQLHWNNPLEATNQMDSSGMTLFLTPKLRPYNAGVFMVGPRLLEIPPGQEVNVAVGKCAGYCTKDMITDKIYVSSVLNHMHYLGTAQITELRRNDKLVKMLADDYTYSYESPFTHNYKDAIPVLPGDEIKTTCVYKSTKRTRTTYFGESTSDEMCIGILTYFPKERMNKTYCFSWYSLDACDFKRPPIQGCNKTLLWDRTDPEDVAVQKKILELCTLGVCRLECLNYVKELKKTPCYSGDVYQMQKFGLEYEQNETQRLQVYYHYAAMDSCDAEIARMELRGGAATVLIAGSVLYLSVLGSWLL